MVSTRAASEGQHAARSGRASIVKHTAFNLFGSIVPNAISFITVPIYFRLIGPERFGVLAIAWLFLGYFGLFDLGLGRATSFRIAALRDAPAADRARTFWTAVLVNLGLGVVGGFALWGAGDLFFGRFLKVAPDLRPELLAGVPFLAAAVPVATLAGVLYGALMGREQFLSTNIVSTLSTLLFQILPIVVVLTFGPHLPLLLAAAILARCAALAVLYFMCHREFARGFRPRIDRGEVRALLSYGLWVTLASLAAPILVFADRFAIGAILGAVAVATYTVPFQLAQRISVVPISLAMTLFPKFVPASAAENARISRIMTLSIASFLTFPVMLAIVFLRPFLDLWVGGATGVKAAPVGGLLLIGFWLNAFAYVPQITLQASGRPRMVALVLILQIPAYLFALYLGMSGYGLMGCAFVFCLRNIVDWLMLAWTAHNNLSGWPVIGINLVLLAAAALLVDVEAVDWIRYPALGVVLLATLATAWFAAPTEAKRLALSRLVRLRGGTV
jgi:O-antigen/teichoic acid export membrane protein